MQPYIDTNINKKYYLFNNDGLSITLFLSIGLEK